MHEIKYLEICVIIVYCFERHRWENGFGYKVSDAYRIIIGIIVN